MATFADVELEERRRLRQRRKPVGRDLLDVRVPPGSLMAGQAHSVGAQGVRPGAIPVGGVSGKNIKANSITANHITAGSIDAKHIKAGSITANHIAARTITADKIVVGTLTATEIMADSITADRIVTHSLTASQIFAGTITATEIRARTITAAEIFAGTITATEIHSGAIEAGKIATGGVIAGNLASGSVTAGTVVAGAVTANLIGAGQISAVLIDIVSSGQLRAVDGAAKVRATMDASGFTVYGPDGATVWMSPSNGILTPGIASGAVGAVQIVDGGVGTAELAAFSVAAGKVAANAIAANELAANTIVAAHILSQKITGINIYASGFSNSEPDAGKKFVLDSNGVHIRTSNAATAAFQYLDFFDGSFARRAAISYEYYSLVDQLTLTSVGSLQITATSVNLNNSLRVEGSVRVVGASGGEYRMEGVQVGLYVVIRFQAAAAGHWYGTHCQFRGRRVDGAGNGAAPSSLTVTQTLQTNLVTAWDIVSTTSYGAMISVGSTAAGGCYYAIHVSTN